MSLACDGDDHDSDGDGDVVSPVFNHSAWHKLW